MKKKYVCANGCRPDTDTPFFYSASVCNLVDGDPDTDTYELGVLVYPDLTISNRWEDGVAGIPQSLYDALTDYSELPICVECYEDIEEEQ
jgi:hypothetical protein